MTGRNDPCPCGSGKKYKKCCGKVGDDLLSAVVNEELDHILTQFFDTYPTGTTHESMMRLMRQWAEQLRGSWEPAHIEEAASEFYLFIEDNEQWKAYIRKQQKEAARGTVQDVLRKWEEPFMLLGEITAAKPNTLEVTKLLTNEVIELARIEGMPADEGTLLFGVVLPDARRGENAVAPVSSMLFLAKWSKQTKKSLLELREKSSDDTPEEFIRKHTLEIYELLVKRSMASMNEMIEDVLAPAQLTALKKLDEQLARVDEPADVREMLQKLAVAYFLNTEVLDSDELDGTAFVQAAILVGQSLSLVKSETAFEIAGDSETVEQYRTELKELYDAMMTDGDAAAAAIYEIGTDPRPTESELWETAMTTSGVVEPERRPGVDEGRAQRLAYEAFGAETEEARRKLAESSLKIVPSLSDALLLKTETVHDIEQVNELYERAIREASKRFEAGENPWQNIPNRPFMRAAFAYGAHLFMHGEFHEAAEVFLDLVRMNTTDNQGARYEAIASLIHAGRFNEAGELLVRYERGSENDATYLYLDWKLENEASGGASEEEAEMLKKASAANGNVMHLMAFRAQTIAYPRYERLEPGSKEEARYIWLLLNGPSGVKE
ncbi:SEC-C metal-binding domain-containing protein [Sporosarcina aquimarina]|uniref:SEC-C metal-binding domain-containing protein n=1 Tax=Sporosarcina aquimarina TaxID=114975 RepID=A0ABU4FUZ3_9BACL|nr:SEC-C metal-binding domain-containing protein [Sporosarcina aquimarina]MDW0108538.1 SEC-C metal-binding domain-containing protein [Sporosarcina aquimarina]